MAIPVHHKHKRSHTAVTTAVQGSYAPIPCNTEKSDNPEQIDTRHGFPRTIINPFEKITLTEVDVSQWGKPEPDDKPRIILCNSHGNVSLSTNDIAQMNAIEEYNSSPFTVKYPWIRILNNNNVWLAGLYSYNMLQLSNILKLGQQFLDWLNSTSPREVASQFALGTLFRYIVNSPPLRKIDQWELIQNAEDIRDYHDTALITITQDKAQLFHATIYGDAIGVLPFKLESLDAGKV